MESTVCDECGRPHQMWKFKTPQTDKQIVGFGWCGYCRIRTNVYLKSLLKKVLDRDTPPVL